MDQTIQTILNRRSTRSFRREPLKEEDVRTIVDCALHAPSGMGKQTWKFTVVENREKIQRLAAAIGAELGRDGYDMYQPEVLVIPSNLKESKFGPEDNACAMENIYLASEALGIGCVWINQLQGICDTPQIRKVLEEFHIPADHVVYGMAALGYKEGGAPAPKERIGEVEYIR